MYGTSDIYGSWGTKEMGGLKWLYGGNKSQIGDHLLWGEFTPLDTMS